MTDTQVAIANRYRLLRTLGSGTNAEVYEAFDETRQSSVALKRLRPERAEKKSSLLLFQREYNTLVQLRHPNIVAAYEYGSSPEGPFYTMELADGPSLRDLLPMEFRQACAVLRDVASGLSLLHSRRLVHRDVTPRNVSRDKGGRAKLLDFGALSPMGIAHELVGTPPFVPPESLDGRPLDARSDLYSLGALAYVLLTGEHAYPAIRTADLRQTWYLCPAPPSSRAPDVPHALDELVLSLLSLNPLARPTSAAETFDRLTAIGDLEPSEAPEVATSYLTAPALVGRGDAVMRFRRRLLRLERRRGSTLVIEGKSGLGRSRLLEAFLSEARLRNMTALYAAGEEGKGGAFSVARTLARRLAETEPALWNKPSPLAQEDGLRSGSSSPDSDETPELIARVTEWFCLADGPGLVIGTDNLEAVDEPSAAILLRLGEMSRDRRIILVATAEPQSSNEQVQRFRQLGGSVALGPLEPSETAALLASVFNGAPHLEAMAAWAHSLAEGSPRITLELAEHLVRCGLARYEQGTWTLPSSIEALELPAALEQALASKVQILSPLALALAQTLALCPDHQPIALTEYERLASDADWAALLTAVDELVARSVLSRAGEAYVLSHELVKTALRGSLSEHEKAAYHRKLADAHAGQSAEGVLEAYHRLEAGDEAGALARFLEDLSRRSRRSERARSFVRSPTGARFFERMFELAQARHASPKQLIEIGTAVLQLASAVDVNLVRHAPLILQRLKQDSGLVFWEQIEQDGSGERAVQCLGRAQAIHDQTDESERGLAPIAAVRSLAMCAVMLSGVYARICDPEKVRELTVLLDRLRSLAPSVGVMADITAYTDHALRGLSGRALRARVLDQLSQPVVGFPDGIRQATRMITLYYHALSEAVVADPAVFDHISELEGRPQYAPLVWQLRVIAFLFQGKEGKAEECRRKRDLMLTGRADVDRQIETSTPYEADAYVALGDLMGLKRLLPTLRSTADRFPGWTPQYLTAQGGYRALRGELDGAKACYEEALETARPGEHVEWLKSTCGLLRVLLQQGAVNEAWSTGQSALAQCDHFSFHPHLVYQLQSLVSLAQLRQGDPRGALERACEATRLAEEGKLGGILLIDLYVAQVEIARESDDAAAVAAASKRLAALCSDIESAPLAARVSSVLELPVLGGFKPAPAVPRGLGRTSGGASALASKIRTELEVCRGAEERAKRSLELILEYAGCRQGFLYLNRSDGMTLAASQSNAPPPAEMEERLLAWLTRASDSESGPTQSQTIEPGSVDGSPAGFAIIAIQALGNGARLEEDVLALVVLDCRSERFRGVDKTLLDAVGQSLLQAGDAH